MSLADIGLRETGGWNAPPIDKWVVNSGQTELIQAGEPGKQSAAAANNLILLVDADLTVGTDQPFGGVASESSTEDASNSGYVNVYTPGMWLLYENLVLTASTANTQSEIDAFIGEAHLIDLTSSAFRMDAAAGNTATNAFIIMGGDPVVSSVFFRIRLDAVRFGRAEV